MARGEYISFVDSDDTVSWNYHRPMLKAAEAEGLDIVINDWAFHTESTRYCCRTDTTLCTDMSLEGDEVLRAFLSQSGLQHSFYVLWNKLYKAELLRYAAGELSELANSVERFNYSEDPDEFLCLSVGKKRLEMSTRGTTSTAYTTRRAWRWLARTD